MSPSPFPVRRVVVAAALVATALVTTLTTSTDAAPARPTASSATDNPLTAVPWGIYRGHAESAYAAWSRSTGTNRTLLGKIALRPRMIWIGHWMTTASLPAAIGNRIHDFQRDDPDGLVQLATFRTYTRGEGQLKAPLSAAAQASYKAWYRQLAASIGTAHAVVVLEPDLPLAWKGWRPGVRFALVRYAAQVLSAQPNTTVYLDAGDADWLTPAKATQMLLLSGVQYARGFALGATHYSSVDGNRAYGEGIVAALAQQGVPGRHFVIDTADNGRPFTWGQFHVKHPHGDFNNANVCRTTTEIRCDTLGLPPTPVTDGTSVDGYLWFGRPWLYRQSDPFQMGRALAVARTTPY